MYIIVLSLLLGFSQLFGEKFMIDCPKEITPECEEKAFGIKYGVTTLDKAVEEMVSDVCDEYFGTNFISKVKKEIEKNPKGLGEYIEYWDNGQIKVKLPYKDGKAHGHIHGWYDNGGDAFKGYFHDGVKQSVHMSFLIDKKYAESKAVRLIRYNIFGKLNGEIQSYHTSSKRSLKVFTEYKNGKAHGECIAWKNNKEEIFHVDYKKGLLQKKPPLPPSKRPYITREQDIIANRVQNCFVKKVREELGLYCEGSGGKQAYDIQSYRLQFRIVEKGTIERARELIVKITEMFKEEINNDKDVRPYLREYPFPHERIEIRISFSDEKGYRYKDGSVAFCTYEDPYGIYYYYLPEKNEHCDLLKKEPFQEAFDKVFPQNRVKP